jgi:RNA polymerase sigma factor (sigma-70 family)
LRNRTRAVAVAGQVRSLFDNGAAGTLADGELLERFATRVGDPAEAAFAALVERHGPMVLRACRAILRDPHLAQDAFQSTFLLLARRAGSLWVRDSIGPWLHSVACRVASGARAADARRHALERRAAARASRSTDEPSRDDLGPALHEEIERLPERLKAPVVLCYLEGLTHDQAADHLGCPVGTVRSRLARGRDRLRRGLTRRGLAPQPSTDPIFPTVPALPPAMAALAIRAARLASGRATVGPVARWLVFLSESVLKPMTIHPLKSAGAIATGLGATSGQEPNKEAERRVAERRYEVIEARFEALLAESRLLRLRVEELERKLEALDPTGKSARPAGTDPRTLHKVWVQLDNALVEKVHVSAGQAVKKGDPLLEFRSAELGEARNACRSSFVQWEHDHKYLVAREPLARDARITQILWADTVNSEKQSRLSYLLAREKLEAFGMTPEAIDQLLEGLSDNRDQARKAIRKNMDITRMTLTSPVDGTVTEVNAAPGNFYDRKDLLMIIAAPKP